MDQIKKNITLRVTVNGNTTTQTVKVGEKKYMEAYSRMYENGKKAVTTGKLTTAILTCDHEGVTFAYHYMDKMLFTMSSQKPVDILVVRR